MVRKRKSSRRSKTSSTSCAVLKARVKSARTRSARGKALGQAAKNHCYRKKRRSKR